MFADDILGPVRQWGFLVKDLDQAMANWVEQLGIGPWWGYRNVKATGIVGDRQGAVEMQVGLSYHQGVQIELIHQTNDAESPYVYFYRESDDAQVLQQIAYMVADVEEAKSQCEARGMQETGRLVTGPGVAYVYMSSPAMKGLVVELMPRDDEFMKEYERAAAEAATWDGSEPYRLISF